MMETENDLFAFKADDNDHKLDHHDHMDLFLQLVDSKLFRP